MTGYAPHTASDIQEMMGFLGISRIEELFKDIPPDVRITDLPGIPNGSSEPEVLDELTRLSSKNIPAGGIPHFLGAGAYNHFVPSAVSSLVSRSEFSTAYTPYQPEVSQGNLQAIYEYQSMICALTKLPVSNASLYDGATAIVEAAAISVRTTWNKKILISRAVSPLSRQVLQSYAAGAGWDVEEIPFDAERGSTKLDVLAEKLRQNPASFIFQQPNFFGVLESAKEIGELLTKVPSLLISSICPISLGLLAPPGDYGADIAVGNGQPLGNHLNFGGPTFGFFACKKEYIRQVPGRMAGRTKDVDGKDGFVLTLQTREQHIRREKATSNICTNEALNALAGSIYLSLMGPKGLRQVALLTLERSLELRKQMKTISGVLPLFSGPCFREFAVTVPVSPSTINQKLLREKIMGGFDLSTYYPEFANGWLLAATELTRESDIQALVSALPKILK